MLYHFPILLKQVQGQIVCNCVFIFCSLLSKKASVGLCGGAIFIANLEKTCVCDAHYCPLLSNFLKFPEAVRRSKGMRMVGRMVEWRLQWRWIRSGR